MTFVFRVRMRSILGKIFIFHILECVFRKRDSIFVCDMMRELGGELYPDVNCKCVFVCVHMHLFSSANLWIPYD